MALHTKVGNEIPKDAVLLSPEDAIEFQRNIIQGWKNSGDVFYLRNGNGVLAGATALASMYINNYYRHRMRLQSFARLSTYGPVVVIPAVAGFIIHAKGITDQLLIERFPCAVCLELKSVCLHLVTSVAYPLMLAPLSSFMMALRYYTYNVPSISSDAKSVLQLYKKISAPMVPTFIGLTALQVLIAAFVTYKEEQNILTVKQKLLEMEQEYDNKFNII